ncbi:archaeosortase/exosortase family protein [Nibricoccus aquaticus]|nr:exosortase/archaeosortase family protein [Nibricoccus aquaticus]
MKSLPIRPFLLVNLSLIALFWLLLFIRIHTEWIVNDLYAYGWAVPFLAAYLFAERWRDRPAPATDRPHPLWLVIPVLLLLAYLPLRIVNEANPDWVKVNVYLTALTASFSFAALFAMGRHRWVWHFAFPILFVFTALPWPVAVEENIVQTLTRWNTLVSADTLTLCGIPAINQGNLIQIGETWVNVAEACSGIRSLQTSFMMSLFLGEFYRMGPFLRLLLVGSSFVVAFVLNIGRTTTLTYLAGTRGNDVMEKWHDHIGTAVMVLCLAGLWFLALGFDKLRAKLASLDAAEDAATATAAPKIAPPPSPPASPLPLAPIPFPIALVAFGFIALATAEIATEAWYRHHEAQLPPPKEWAIHWPKNADSFKMGEFPERTRAILKYNEGETASWTTPEGYSFQMYYVRWYPGRVSKFLSGAHHPTVCLPATGLKLKSETGPFSAHTPALDVPFSTYIFEAGPRTVYVYHAIMEDIPLSANETVGYTFVKTEERIDSVLRGQRNLGQRVIGISLSGPYARDEAEAIIQKTLSQLIRPLNAPQS